MSVKKPRTNPLAIAYALLRSHTRLFYYELQHEKDLAWRRLRFIGVGVVCLMAGGAFVEIAGFEGLRTAGLDLFRAAAIMAVINALVGSILIWQVGKRPLTDGPAFEMTRAEYERTRQWIENRFAKDAETSVPSSN